MALLYADITEKIIGCAMKVHAKMKTGYAEAEYQKCMAIELKKVSINFLQEADIGIYYDNIVVGRRRVDFLIENKIAVELKAVSKLTDAHLAQAVNYLETNRLEVGLPINFGAKSLQFKRLINQHKLQDFPNPANPIQNPTNPRS